MSDGWVEPSGGLSTAVADQRYGLAAHTWTKWLATAQAAGQPFYLTHKPSAVFDPASNCTLVFYMSSQDRAIYVTGMDHTNARPLPKTFVAAYAPTLSALDSHGGPTVAIAADGHYVLTFGAHNIKPRFVRSVNAHDPTAWSAEYGASNVPIGTYHNIVLHTDGSLYDCYRTGSGHPSTVSQNATYPMHEFGTIIKSTDNGLTWTDLGASINGLVNCQHVFTGSTEICADFYVNGLHSLPSGKLAVTWMISHGPTHDAGRMGIYHAEYDPAGGHWWTTSGTDLGTRLDSTNMNSVKIVDFTNTLDCITNTTTAVDPATGHRLIVGMHADDTAQQCVGVACYFNGSTWTATDTGARAWATVNGNACRWRSEGGGWEAWFVTGGFPANWTTGYTTSPGSIAGTAQAGLRQGGDLTHYTSPDGVTWTRGETVAERSVCYVQSPASSDPACKITFAPAAPGANSPARNYPLWLATDSKAIPGVAVTRQAETLISRKEYLDAGAQVMTITGTLPTSMGDTATDLIFTDSSGTAVEQTGAGGGKITLANNVSTSGVVEVGLMVIAIGKTGTAAGTRATVRFRAAGTNRAYDAVMTVDSSLSSISTAALVQIAVPLSADQSFEFYADPTISRLQFVVVYQVRELQVR